MASDSSTSTPVCPPFSILAKELGLRFTRRANAAFVSPRSTRTAASTSIVDPLALDLLRMALPGRVHTPDDIGYDAARSGFSLTDTPTPEIVVMAESAADVGDPFAKVAPACASHASSDPARADRRGAMSSSRS